MEIRTLDHIISNIIEKSKSVHTKSEEICKLKNDNLPMNENNLRNLEIIMSNLNLINNSLDDLKLELLGLQDENILNSEQKELLKEYKFQKIFKKVFLPLILYLRLNIENES